MDTTTLFRQLLRTPASHRTALFPPKTRPQSRFFAMHAQQPLHARYLTLPTIIRPSFWASMIPKPLRSLPSTSPSRNWNWNPATPYIVLGLLVGSQAIQILWLKQERGHNLRKAEAKLGLLKEVIERVQSGEAVDVEKVLGTGDAEREAEWRELVRGVKGEEALYQSKKRRRALREEGRVEEEKERETVVEGEREAKMKVESFGGGKFY